MQVSGSFKGRGAFHKLLASKVPAAGIVAASGWQSRRRRGLCRARPGHKAEIFVPTIAASAKGSRGCTATARSCIVGAVYAEARAASEKRAAETGALIVPAYEDEVVFAGAGSVALEFAEQAEFDALLIAVGGGGLIAGCAAAIGSSKKIVAVETEGTPTLHEALKAEPVDVAISGIAADALGASRIGTPNFEVARTLVRDSVLVTDEAVRETQRVLGRIAHRRRTGRCDRPRRAARRRVSSRTGRTRRDADLRRQHRSRLGSVAKSVGGAIWRPASAIPDRG